MSYASSTVSVGTTATNIVVGGSGMVLKNNGPVTVFLGGGSTVTADVSVTGGWQLHPGEIWTLTHGDGVGTVWGITASETSYISWIV